MTNLLLWKKWIYWNNIGYLWSDIGNYDRIRAVIVTQVFRDISRQTSWTNKQNTINHSIHHQFNSKYRSPERCEWTTLDRIQRHRSTSDFAYDTLPARYCMCKRFFWQVYDYELTYRIIEFYHDNARSLFALLSSIAKFFLAFFLCVFVTFDQMISSVKLLVWLQHQRNPINLISYIGFFNKKKIKTRPLPFVDTLSIYRQ